ncbi:SCN8A, partial [Symbiodinium sp. KB8]
MGRDPGPISGVEWLVGSPLFDAFCALIVVSNSIFLGVEVQMGITYFDEGLPVSMSVVQYVYAAWFLLELLLRIRADGRNFIFSPDWSWNLLDIFVVITSLWEVAAELVYTILQNDIGDVAGMSSLKAFRIIRVTRVVKVVRLMRVFRFVMAFRTLITSIADTLKSLFWALMLLAVIVYVFAVLFTQAVNDYVLDPDNPTLPDRELEASERYYRSLYHTMLSLFMGVSGGINWSEVMAPLLEISPIWVFMFLFYICFTYFAVLNVVTGVFCQTAIESAQNDHTAVVHSILKNKQAHVEKIRALFNSIGDDQTGIITFAMFEEKINSPAVKAYFEVLGLDVWDAWSFFKLLDLDDGGDVEIEEFLMGCLRLRGTARAIDVGKIIHDQTWLIRTHGKFQTYVEAELKKIQEQLLWMA